MSDKKSNNKYYFSSVFSAFFPENISLNARNCDIIIPAADSRSGSKEINVSAEEQPVYPAYNTKEEKEEKFVPKPYIGKTNMTKAKSKKAAEKKVPEKKEPEKKPEPEVKKDVPEGQMSLLDLAMQKSA